jgi:hypothetical protein
MTTWETWAAGVLNGISAPINATNVDTLWAWSGSESGTADRMRWGNPLNTTLQWLSPPSHPMNSVGVQFFMDVPSGIAATVDTLLNGYYPTIISHLRNSVPRAQWTDACHELGTWGTGCGWLLPAYGPAPGNLGADMTPEESSTLMAAYAILAGSRINSKAVDQALVDLAAVPESTTTATTDPAVTAALTVINAKLDAIATKLAKDLA